MEGKKWQLEKELAGDNASTVRVQKWMLVLGWLSPFHSVQGPRPRDGGTHRFRGSSHLS